MGHPVILAAADPSFVTFSGRTFPRTSQWSPR